MISILKDKKIYLFLVITLLFFGMYLQMEYATDTYNVFASSNKADIYHFIKSGRIVTAIWWGIMTIFDLNEIAIYITSTIMAILATIISQYKLFNIINKDLKSINISILISTIVILNPFSIELFMFVEKGILMLSVLFNILALDNLIKYFQGNKKSLFLSVLFMILATFSYQGTVALFIALAVLYIVKYSKNLKEFIINNIVTALCYGVPAILNYLMVKFVFANARTTGEINIVHSIEKVFKGTWNILIYTSDIVPKYLYFTIVLIIISIVIFKIFTRKIEFKNKLLDIFKLLYIILGGIIVSILPYLLQNAESIWIVPRSAYTLASLLGIFLLYLFINFKINKKQETFVVAICIVFLIIQLINFQKITIDHYILNYMDKNISLQIKEVLEQYEEKSGLTVENVAIYTDKNLGYTYSGLFVSGDINIKGYAPDWCAEKIIKYYVRRNVNIVDKDIEIERDFKEKDWNNFDKEQVIFKDNTMHICVF